MVRFMRITPKFQGGMIKLRNGLHPLLRRGGGASHSMIRPPTGPFKKITLTSAVSGGAVSGKKQTYTKLKYLI